MSMLYTIPEEEDSRPSTLEDEIDKLRKELDNYRHDNMYKLFFAVNRKSGEIADALNSADLTLKSDDKVFDKFIKLMEKMEALVKTLNTLRQDYLKLPEDELETAEKKGIPLIEKRAQKSNKR